MDNPEYAQTVAHATFAAMVAGGETQLGLSVKTGIPRTTLARRLSGSSPFTVAELAAIADVLGIPVASLVTPAQTAAA